MKYKMDSPHAIVRSHSPAVAIRGTDYNRAASSTYPSDRKRYSSHSLTRSSKNSNSLQHRSSLNSKATNRQTTNYKSFPTYLPLLTPRPVPEVNLTHVAHDNRSRRRNNQTDPSYQTCPSLNARQPKVQTTVIIRPILKSKSQLFVHIFRKIRSISRGRSKFNVLASSNDQGQENNFVL
ncbi:unnamed protein product [Rodentolepis nana]|uniref:Ovule protein n=1 Tax=Rodentolepis nana TaxID=102285 RepID=A0A0R3T2N9_RODNA|nr:unnamed protein product [Rodentolepis nana]